MKEVTTSLFITYKEANLVLVIFISILHWVSSLVWQFLYTRVLQRVLRYSISFQLKPHGHNAMGQALQLKPHQTIDFIALQ